MTVIYDFHDWLPGGGESDVTFSNENSDLTITVIYYYDNDIIEKPRRKIFSFSGVMAFYYSVTPGPSMVAFSLSSSTDGANLDALVEHPNSDRAEAWNKYWGTPGKKKHYTAKFMNMNLVVHVIADSVMMTDGDVPV